MIINRYSSIILSTLIPVILSLSKDRVLSQCNLKSFTHVILSSSKDGILIQDNLRRNPPHFDKSYPELDKRISVTVENMKKIIEFRKMQILNKLMRI